MRLIDADALARDMGVDNAVKYGNETAEQQHNSYSTLMKYEIADYIEDAPTVDAVPVVRCKDCKNRGTPYNCPMRKLVMPFQGAGSYEDCTEDDGYCHMGELKDGGAC